MNNEFRPIAIRPFLSKVMVNIIARQISYLESHKYLTVTQSGFMKGRSCTAALLNIVEDLRLEMNENRVSNEIVFILLNKLLKLFSFSNSAASLIFSYLLSRCQKVHLNGNISDMLNSSRGVPQASILGPLLFCTYILTVYIY